MYSPPEGRPRSTPPDSFTPPGFIATEYELPGSGPVATHIRPARSEAHRKALSEGMRATYRQRQLAAAAQAQRLNKTEMARLWVNASKYRRIFGLGANVGPHAHAVARGYETRAVTGQGKWTAWVIAVPDADLPEQYRPARETLVKYQWKGVKPLDPLLQFGVYTYDEPRPSLWQRFLAWWRS